MPRGLFITGTDTNVGKTVVAAALMHLIRHKPQSSLRYWKPIQTGVEFDDDTKTVRELGQCAESEILADGFRLPLALSPHLAALSAGIAIDIDKLVTLAEGRPPALWIVEGAGGVLVPINETELMIDLIARLAMPAIVVARSSLGTINHSLLTLEALRARRLPVAGVVMVGEKNKDNRAAIEKYGAVPVLGELPRLDPLNAEALRSWALAELDLEGRLLESIDKYAPLA